MCEREVSDRESVCALVCVCVLIAHASPSLAELRRRLERSGRDLGKTMAAMLTSEHHAIAQALLTTLPCTEAVTTNYDVLFEQAVRACPGESMSVLPMAPDAAAKRWLLKMHGCVTKPEDIVLTRTDYIRYAENNAALGGTTMSMWSPSLEVIDVCFVWQALCRR